mgnify:CR=1 FL=1
MRHEAPLRYGDDGPWHYVSSSSRGAYPIGYCTTACDHASSDEAHEHYRQYVLDNLREVETDRDTMYRCEIDGCDVFTQKGLAEPDGYASRHLCDDHRARWAYETAFYPAGGSIRESWSS